MQRNVVKIKLTPDIKQDAIWLAHARGVTLHKLVQDALVGEFGRDRTVGKKNPTEKQPAGDLSALLSEEFDEATDWDDLEERLKHNGYFLRAVGREMTLCKWPSGTKICSAARLGISYSRMMRRIGTTIQPAAQTQNYSRFKM